MISNNSKTSVDTAPLLLILGFVLLLSPGSANAGYRDRGSAGSAISKTAEISDRAAGTHNGSNIGLFFENRGKLYPRRLADGPSGEFPINSGHHYIYRINPMVGVAPDAASGRLANTG